MYQTRAVLGKQRDIRGHVPTPKPFAARRGRKIISEGGSWTKVGTHHWMKMRRRTIGFGPWEKATMSVSSIAPR